MRYTFFDSGIAADFRYRVQPADNPTVGLRLMRRCHSGSSVVRPARPHILSALLPCTALWLVTVACPLVLRACPIQTDRLIRLLFRYCPPSRPASRCSWLFPDARLRLPYRLRLLMLSMNRRTIKIIAQCGRCASIIFNYIWLIFNKLQAGFVAGVVRLR